MELSCFILIDFLFYKTISNPSIRMKKQPAKLWLDTPEEHDYPAAFDYLELIMTPQEAKQKEVALRKAKVVSKKSKDIFRAGKLQLLPPENIHVKENLKKIKKGKKLSPILLVRMEGILIIADGFHRLCAAYYCSEDLVVPCKLV